MIERVPPNDIEAEQAVVASCLADDRAIADVQAAGLVPDDCYQGVHQEILRAIFRLSKVGTPADLITVRQAMEGCEVLAHAGGFGYLADLASSVPTTAYATHYAKIVVEKARRRSAIYALQDGLSELFDPQAEDPVGKHQARVMGLGVNRSVATTLDFGDAVHKVFDPLYDRIVDPTLTPPPPAFTTGLYDLDYLAWVDPGDLAILGARPSDGKTSLALQMMLHVAGQGTRVLFHSLEMPAKQIAMRYLASMAQVGLGRLRDGQVSQEERDRLHVADSRANDLPFRIDDRPGLSVAAIAANLRREMLRAPVGLLIVDHMLKVRPADGRGSRHNQMTQISNDLSELAKQTKVAVVALYQLSRASASEGRKPRAFDLRESGTVEEDADHIWLLHRPDHAKLISPAEIIVEKNRNGPCGNVSLTFDARQMTFACREHVMEEVVSG